MKRRVELYGRLREAGGDHRVLDLPPRSTAAQALAALKTSLGSRRASVAGCALATETEVLAGSDLIPSKGRLAALPPVCGG
jgi:molybdopterin converting factor small subunit